MIIPVTDVRPGDVITTDSDDITVDAVETVTTHGEHGYVRITGRITRGWGAGNKQLSWTKFTDQTVDVIRPGSGEQVWQFTPSGKPRRVR